ncbi:MAG: gliding motility protein [Bacteroidota bacterium]
MKISPILLLFVSLFTLIGCQPKSEIGENALESIQIETPIIRLDSLLFNAKSEKEVLDFLQKNKSISEPYFEVNAQNFPELAKKLNSFIQNPALFEFYKKSINRPSGIQIDSLQTAINHAFKNIKALYPDFIPPKIHTIFTGFAGKDIFVSDSNIVIGLDFFIGKKAEYRPQVYDYQLFKYQPELIVPTLINLMAVKYARIEGGDKSLLADMLFYGKCYQFTKTMIPNAADSLIIGYTQKQLDDTEASQEMVWGHIIDQKLLFESSPFKKAKYLEERPNTQEISQDCPGAIGRWLGWKIIKKYVENNPQQTLNNLMDNGKAQDIFEKSKYKGKAQL